MIKSKIFSKLLSIALSVTILGQGIMLGFNAYAEDISPEDIKTQGWDF